MTTLVNAVTAEVGARPCALRFVWSNSFHRRGQSISEPMYAGFVAAYLTRLRLASLFAFAAMGLYLLVAKARGRDLLIGFLFALPNLLIIFFPASCVFPIRGIAIAQSLVFCAITGFGAFLGIVLGSVQRDVEPLVFILVLILLCQFFLLRFAAGREPSEAAAKGGPGSGWVFFSGILTVIYQAYVYEFVLRRK